MIVTYYMHELATRFHLRSFAEILHRRFRNYSPCFTNSPIFRGSKLMGHLAVTHCVMVMVNGCSLVVL